MVRPRGSCMRGTGQEEEKEEESVADEKGICMVEIQRRSAMEPMLPIPEGATTPLRRGEGGGSAAVRQLSASPTRLSGASAGAASPSPRGTPPGPQPFLGSPRVDDAAESLESLDEREAIARESSELDALVRRLRSLHPTESVLRSDPIGMALSGGGTRAAAFHTGLFWSLAQSGLLKDVEHMCCVSGGGYTVASYVSHLSDITINEPPQEGMDLNQWYQKVVARFVLRMQCNINYMVDCTPSKLWRKPNHDRPEERGSSCFPRILDFPLCIFALLGSITATPLLLLIHTLWPVVFSIELFHGGLLRRAWCDPDQAPLVSEEVKTWFWQSTLFVAVMAFSSIAVGGLIGLGTCQRTPQRYSAYLYSRSVRHVLGRGAVCFGIYTACVTIIMFWQYVYWGGAAREDTTGAWVRYLCAHYIDEGARNATCHDESMFSSEEWYVQGNVAKYLERSWTEQHCLAPPGAPSWDYGVPWYGPKGKVPTLFGYLLASMGASGILLLVIAVVIWRGKVFKVVFAVTIPVVYFFIVMSIAKWKIYGPITSQYLVPGVEWTRYSRGAVNGFFCFCTASAIATLPFYDSVQKLAHMYQRRALKRAFFCNGRDISFDRMRRNPYCPNVLFGACLHDYRKPWDAKNHVDFTMSTYFVGCEKSGFFQNPPTASLARMMTIAGAATDATFLLNADIFAVRLLLAVVALRFGDFLRLLPDGPMSRRVEGRIASSIDRQASRIENQMPRTAASLVDMSSSQQHWISRWFQGLLDRLPSACPFFVAHVLILVGATIGGTNTAGSPACGFYVWLVYAALWIYALVAMLSFFAYCRPLQWLMRSPMIQQFQMLFMHRYKAAKPPPYLYISDGGLIEPMGIFPLLRRRLRKIVVSDAAEDIDLTMRCLLDALKICREERLCSFYDPNDPHRDMEFVLRDFSRNVSVGFLRLGVRYEPFVDGTRAPDGEMFYLRMRLLPGDTAPVRELLTEADLMGPPPRPNAVPRTSVELHGIGADVPTRSEFGGACLPRCECGGLLAGRRFPNYGVGNQFLTPLMFANLCQLGAELSQPLVRRIASSRAGGSSSAATTA